MFGRSGQRFKQRLIFSDVIVHDVAACRIAFHVMVERQIVLALVVIGFSQSEVQLTPTVQGEVWPPLQRFKSAQHWVIRRVCAHQAE